MSYKTSKNRALESMKEVKKHMLKKRKKIEKTGWDSSGTGESFLPKVFRKYK